MGCAHSLVFRKNIYMLTLPTTSILADSPLRRRSVQIAVIAALLLVLAVSTFFILFSAFRLNMRARELFFAGIPIALGMSLVPLAILWFLDRRERESPWVAVLALIWGAVVATGLALPLNGMVFAAVQAWLKANPDTSAWLGPQGALMIGAPIAGPLVEETTKGLAVLLLLWLLRAEFDSVRDGFIYGALVGIGFNVVEAPLYVAQMFQRWGVEYWGLQYGARFALLGFGGHAFFSGLFGAFVGMARIERRTWKRVLLVLIGWVMALLPHAINNGLPLLIRMFEGSSGTVAAQAETRPPTLGFVTTYIVSSIREIITFLPFLIAMLVILRRSGDWERKVVHDELADEVGRTITPDEYADVLKTGRFASRRGRHTRHATAAALVRAQHELALRKHAVKQAAGDVDADPLVAGWRAELGRLRPPHEILAAAIGPSPQ